MSNAIEKLHEIQEKSYKGTPVQSDDLKEISTFLREIIVTIAAFKQKFFIIIFNMIQAFEIWLKQNESLLYSDAIGLAAMPRNSSTGVGKG